MSATAHIAHRAARSGHPAARFVRRAYRAVRDLSIPAPRVVVKPLLAVVLGLRQIYYVVARVCVCEPLFKAYCAEYGRNLHTGVFFHWVQGAGHLRIGDDVLIDGKCSFSFAARYSRDPTLRIGSYTQIGHNCSFVIGRSITIGEHCHIATDVSMFDSSGHPSAGAAREAGEPAPDESVKPIVIERNVWIGRRAMIFPGVTIGENSVISAGSVVISSIPANSIVLGNPARRLATL